MNDIASPGQTNALEIRHSPGKGRGVFARQPIPAGALIERAPVLVVQAGQWEGMESTILFDYFFAWQEHSALALGYGSLYNHSYTPNAHYMKLFNEEVIEITALRDIAMGEEILINYNGDPGDDAGLCQCILWLTSQNAPPAMTNRMVKSNASRSVMGSISTCRMAEAA
jgi:SET domain-containing protein